MKLKSFVLGLITLISVAFISSVYADDCPPSCSPTASNNSTSHSE